MYQVSDFDLTGVMVKISRAAAIGSIICVGMGPGDLAAEGLGDTLGQFVSNANVKVEVSAMGFANSPESATADDDSVNFAPRVTIGTQGDITETISFNTELYLAYSNQSKEYHGAFRGPGDEGRQPRFVDINTAYFKHDGDSVGVTVGKDFIQGGVAELYSPSNRFGLGNGATPPHSKEYGVWQVGSEYYIADDTLSVKVLPFHERGQVPPGTSRWVGGSGDADFQSVDLPTGNVGTAGTTVTDEFHSASPENFGYLVKYEGSREGFDFFGLANHGPSIYPVLKQKIAGTANYSKVDPLAWSFGGGVSAVKEEWKFYGEGILQITDEDKDQDFFRYVMGFSYRDTEIANSIGIVEIKPIIEYGGEEILDQQSATDFVVDSKNARAFRNTALGRVEIQHNNEISYAIGGAYNFEDKDFNATLGVEYRPNDNLTLQVGGTLFSGKDDTHFGRWRRNDFVEANVSYKF